MGIKYCTGNIFDSKQQILVNPVNTVGVMGAGLAKEFKERFSRLNCVYKSLCNNEILIVGKPQMVMVEDKMILLFPTKENYSYPSRIEYIEEGLRHYTANNAWKEYSIAFPKLGCGLGGLDWKTVKRNMETYLYNYDVEIYV